MSSIYGMVSKTESPPDAAHLAAMRAALPAQSPSVNSDAECHDALVSLGLCHSRRPLLTNESVTIRLACVGTIPNYRDLREELISRGHTFATPHDAETLVHLYEEHGPNLLSSVRGPFSFALWDAQKKCLILACDPTTQKPLYYYEDSHRLVFASTILALLAHPEVPQTSGLTDSFMLALALHTGQMPATMTAFQGIRVLGVGQKLLWQADQAESTKQQYWGMPALTPAEAEATIVDHEDRLRERLAESVRLHLTPDDLVGVLLSGGINSSLVAAMMQQQNRLLQTFTVRFGPKDTPETARAAQVAKHLQAKHTVLTIKTPDLSQLLPHLVWQTAHPFLSPHDLLMGVLSEAIQGQIQVALIGTGGAPLLGNPMSETKARPRLRRMWQVASTLLQRTRARQREEALRSSEPQALLLSSEVEALLGVRPDFSLPLASPLGQTSSVIHLRLIRRLAPIIHVSAAYGIETQVPFADAQVIEAAALVPVNLKQRPGQPLYILHELARGLLPRALLDSPMVPERLPLDGWIRDQQTFVREVLLSERTRSRNLLNSEAVSTLIEGHMTNRHDASTALLALMSLELWHRLFIDAPHVIPSD